MRANSRPKTPDMTYTRQHERSTKTPELQYPSRKKHATAKEIGHPPSWHRFFTLERLAIHDAWSMFPKLRTGDPHILFRVRKKAHRQQGEGHTGRHH